MLNIKITQFPYDRHNPVFNKNNVKLLPEITVLVGPNGAGKTTFMNQILEGEKAGNYAVFNYSNYRQGGSTGTQAFLQQGNLEALANSVFCSEGEQLFAIWAYNLDKLGQFMLKHKKTKDVIILLDACDSGLDIDGMIRIKDFFRNFPIKERKNLNTYVIIATNAYEFAQSERCLDVTELEYIKFDSYAEYKTFILKRAKKNNRQI